MTMHNIKPIPNFKNEDEERDFWATHDATDYFDMSKAQRAYFPNLKPSTETISLRLPQDLLSNLKVLANKQDVPYQSLMKIFLAERVRHELRDQGIKAYEVKKDPDQEKEE